MNLSDSNSIQKKWNILTIQSKDVLIWHTLRNNDRILKSLFSTVKLLYVYQSRKHCLRCLGDEPRWSKRCWLGHGLCCAAVACTVKRGPSVNQGRGEAVWHSIGSDAWEFTWTFGQAVSTISSHFSWPPHSILLCDPFRVYDPQFMRLCFRVSRKEPLHLWLRQKGLEETTLGSCMSWWDSGPLPWAAWLVSSFSC